MTHEYDPERFGQVLATLEAQNRVLQELHEDVEKLFGMVHALQTPRSKTSDRDYIEIIISAILGAVAYFMFAHLIEK